MSIEIFAADPSLPGATAAPGLAPTVSVVVPAYNRAGSIVAAIESVLRQSYADFELLVVDDASSDGTLDAAGTVRDPRIRLLANPRNLGAAGARNTGLAAARGTWIAFQDSDDEWLPRKLELQMARLTAPGADYIGAYCGMLILGTPAAARAGLPPDRPQVRYFPGPDLDPVEGDILPTLLRASLVSTQTLVARRDLLQRIGGFDASLQAMEDWECMLRLAPLGRFALVDEPLVQQHFSANSITRDFARSERARAAIVEKHRELFGRDPSILAQHYYFIAGGQRQVGNLAGARAALAQARALQPMNPRFWAMTAYLRLTDLERLHSGVPGRGAARHRIP